MWSVLTPAQRLCALYNAAKPQGMGMLHFISGDMPEGEAAQLIANGCGYFDYHKGRVMKIDVTKAEPDYRLYDRDNGHGAGARAIEKYADRVTAPA